MLGEKILRLRKNNGFSQEELASRLTVSRQAISKWELGESVPDTENIMQLSKLFGVSTDYLLNDDYESDMDIPAVKTNAAELQKEYAGDKSVMKLKVAGWILSVLGLLNIFGFVLVYRRFYSVLNFDVHPYPNENQWESPFKDFNFVDFLTMNRLEILFAICCLLLLAGITLLIIAHIKKKRRI